MRALMAANATVTTRILPIGTLTSPTISALCRAITVSRPGKDLRPPAEPTLTAWKRSEVTAEAFITMTAKNTIPRRAQKRARQTRQLSWQLPWSGKFPQLQLEGRTTPRCLNPVIGKTLKHIKVRMVLKEQLFCDKKFGEITLHIKFGWKFISEGENE